MLSAPVCKCRSAGSHLDQIRVPGIPTDVQVVVARLLPHALSEYMSWGDVSVLSCPGDEAYGISTRARNGLPLVAICLQIQTLEIDIDIAALRSKSTWSGSNLFEWLEVGSSAAAVMLKLKTCRIGEGATDFNRCTARSCWLSLVNFNCPFVLFSILPGYRINFLSFGGHYAFHDLRSSAWSIFSILSVVASWPELMLSSISISTFSKKDPQTQSHGLMVMISRSHLYELVPRWF